MTRRAAPRCLAPFYDRAALVPAPPGHRHQFTYYSTKEKAFSHGQGRRLMGAKLAASLAAVGASVPYWRALGLIR